MEFPITDLMSLEYCKNWIIEHFHPNGLVCPSCSEGYEKARIFRQTKKSQLTVYRCNQCHKTFNLYSGTVFQQRHLTPQQVVLFIRGVLKGEPTTVLSAELGLNYQTCLNLRHELQENAEQLQPETPLDDLETETDEMFQNAGEKRG